MVMISNIVLRKEFVALVIALPVPTPSRMSCHAGLGEGTTNTD